MPRAATQKKTTPAKRNRTSGISAQSASRTLGRTGPQNRKVPAGMPLGASPRAEQSGEQRSSRGTPARAQSRSSRTSGGQRSRKGTTRRSA